MSAEESPNPMLVAALAYAARGIRVAPAHGIVGGVCTCGETHDKLSDNGKHPRTQRGLADGTTDPGIIREWWRKWPDSNIMVCTGKMSDGRYLTVLDVDVKDDRDGHERLREIETQFSVRLPESPVALSGRSGGMHCWFVSDVLVRNGAGILPRGPGDSSGLDVRGEGGYVIAPPSRHYSGDAYTWDSAFVGELPAWPTWLGGNSDRQRKSDSEPVADVFVMGGRNNALASLAGVVRRKGMGQREVEALLQEVNRVRCRPPLDPKDVSKIAWSVAKYPASEPLTGAESAASPAASDWFAGQYVADAATFTTRPRTREYLLTDTRTGHGVLPVGKAGMLIAEGGAGKTMALTQLGIAIATGTAWLGVFRAVKPGRVLLLLGEEDTEEVQRRLYNARDGVGSPIPPDRSIVVLPLAGKPSVMVECDDKKKWVDGEFLVALRAFIKETGPYALVGIDPLSRFAGADAEKDNAAATRFVQAVESIAGNVLTAHHNNKESRGDKPWRRAKVETASARGSSAFTDGMRWVMTMTPEVYPVESELQSKLGDIITVSVTKSNYARKPKSIQVRRAEHGTLVLLDGYDSEIINSSREVAEKSRAQKRHAENDKRRAERADQERAERAQRQAEKDAVEAKTLASVLLALERESVLNQANLLVAMAALGAVGRKDKLLAVIKRHVLDGTVEERHWGDGKSVTYTLACK